MSFKRSLRSATILPVILLLCTFLKAKELQTKIPFKTLAVFFAINEYDNSELHKLEHPISDATKIASVLNSKFGFDTIICRNFTYNQIVDKFNDKTLKNSKEKYDQLLIFFSGHGTKDGQNGYFLAKDSDPKVLSDETLAYNVWIHKINELKFDRILVLIDACESGTFNIDSEYFRKHIPGITRSISKLTPKRNGEKTEYRKFYEKMIRTKTRKFYTSTKEGESNDNSYFSSSILELFKSINPPENNFFTLNDLNKCLETTSYYSGNFGDNEEDSNFLFACDEAFKKDFNEAVNYKNDTIIKYWRSAKETEQVKKRLFRKLFASGSNFLTNMSSILNSIEEIKNDSSFKNKKILCADRIITFEKQKNISDHIRKYSFRKEKYSIDYFKVINTTPLKDSLSKEFKLNDRVKTNCFCPISLQLLKLSQKITVIDSFYLSNLLDPSNTEFGDLLPTLLYIGVVKEMNNPLDTFEIFMGYPSYNMFSDKRKEEAFKVIKRKWYIDASKNKHGMEYYINNEPATIQGWNYGLGRRYKDFSSEDLFQRPIWFYKKVDGFEVIVCIDTYLDLDSK